MTIGQKAPDSRVWRSALRAHEESLQIADSVEKVIDVVRRALESLPGVGQGAVFLTAGAGDVRRVATVKGPESDRLTAPGIELTGLARRALRERRTVQQAGSAPGTLWAAVLQSPRGLHGAVAVVGENEEIPGLLAHAGMALGRETERERGASTLRAAEERAENLECAVGILDSIACEGGSENVLRRIASAFARIPGIGKTSLWCLRRDDGVYVEVARNANGTDVAYPAPPPDARRGETLRAWWEALPRTAGFAWWPAGSIERPRPGTGDTLFVPLSRHDSPLLQGFLMAEVEAPLEDALVVEDVQRWASLARVALESRAEGGSGLSYLEELREEQQHVADLHRLKTQFIAAVSHELRTPLTSISAYAEALRQSQVAEQTETRDRFLQVIHEESRRLARIVDDILDLATMDSGHVRLSCRRVDLVGVIRGALDVIRPIADRKRIGVVPPSPEPAEVHADPDLMKQLVVNLLENAVKFTKEGGEIRLIVERESSSVRLVVEDEGPGIPADKLDAIFETFYQVDGTDSREHGGSGLGLAICRSIVSWHDGRIWAESDSGHGARMVVSLPRVRAVSHPRAEAPEGTAARREENRIPELMIEMVSEVIGAEAVSLMLLDETGHDLFIQAAIGVPEDVIRDVRVALGERIAGHVAATGEALLIPDVERDGRFPTGGGGRQYRTRSVMSVPVQLRGEPIGVLNATNKTSGEAFTEQDRRLLEMLAQRVALALQKLREYGSRRDSIERLEEAISGVIDARRHYFPSRENHSRLVLAVCEELGIDPEETTRIHYASIVRDVGMMRLPEGVYRKPVRLSSSDRELVRRHPEEGARTIRPIEFQSDVFDMVLSHHEEPDGTGYPRGLSGEGIPRGARILAVVDAYDALRTGRPYKPAVSVREAVDELRRHAGRQFDEEIVNALVRVLEGQGDLPSSPEPESRGES